MSTTVSRFSASFILTLLFATEPAYSVQSKEIKVATVAYTHGFKSGGDGVKVHLRLNADEEPEDRPMLIWPLSADNPNWVIVPEFSMDLGNEDDVAPNNVVTALHLQTVSDPGARKVLIKRGGFSWLSARDFSTSLVLVGAGVAYEWFGAGYTEGKQKIASEIAVRADMGPRLNRGSASDPFTFRLTPTGTLAFERSTRRGKGKLVLSGGVFAFANDDFQADSATHYTDELLGLVSAGVEFRPARPVPGASAESHAWPVGFVMKYTYGHKPPVFKLQNVLELGARLYWTPPQP